MQGLENWGSRTYEKLNILVMPKGTNLKRCLFFSSLSNGNAMLWTLMNSIWAIMLIKAELEVTRGKHYKNYVAFFINCAILLINTMNGETPLYD